MTRVYSGEESELIQEFIDQYAEHDKLTTMKDRMDNFLIDNTETVTITPYKKPKPKPRPMCARCGVTKQYSGWCGECFAYTDSGHPVKHHDQCKCNKCRGGK